MRMMSSLLKIATITAAGAALFGCGNGNGSGSAALVDSKGQHKADYVHLHGADAQASIADCKGCHGNDLLGGISKVSCMSTDPVSGFRCHVTSPEDDPTGCVSCHGGPNAGGPFGNTAPNRQFAHGKHTLLTGCDACHENAGAGTITHAKASAAGGYNRATVSLAAGVQAKPAAPVRAYNNDGTCSAVSCHGGQTTLAWSTGVMTIATDCLLCHEQGTAPVVLGGTPTPQYNSFYSGISAGSGNNLHEFHLRPTTLNASGNPVGCTDCHDGNTLNDYQKHFSGLAGNTFTAPGATIGFSAGSYDATAKTCSNVACHPPLPATYPWE